MAWLKSRTKQDGTVQYTGMYRDLQGHERSAGTHTSKREALRKAAAAESQAQAGKVGDPKRGRQTLRHYVEHEWLPNHVMEDSTRESYTYVIERHILGPLGRMRLVDIMPWHIRDWITELAGQGVRAPTIRSAKVCLDAVLSTAFHDQIIELRSLLNIPENLSAMGVQYGDLDMLTDMALEDPSCGGNPIAMTKENTRKLFDSCM